jgi:hypothetical protein
MLFGVVRTLHTCGAIFRSTNQYRRSSSASVQPNHVELFVWMIQPRSLSAEVSAARVADFGRPIRQLSQLRFAPLCVTKSDVAVT